MVLLEGPKTVIHCMSYGGMDSSPLHCLVRDWGCIRESSGYCKGKDIPVQWEVTLNTQNDDAAIDAVRSIVATKFLETDAEVLFCIDHDHTWNGPCEDYEGDILHCVRKAKETRAIVGALISKKRCGAGVAASFAAETEIVMGSDSLVEVVFNGFAFTAIHRSVLETIAKDLPVTCDGEIPFFLPQLFDLPGRGLTYLREDLAFAQRVRTKGIKIYIATRPMVRHIGPYEYSVVKDSQAKT